MKSKVVVVSGGFDPVHIGHVQMFKAAKELVGPRGKVIVVVNCDAWLKRKKGTVFMDQGERAEIVSSFAAVDEVYIHESDDDHVCGALRIIRPDIFGNGGDRESTKDIPEAHVCEELGIEMVFNLGDKIQSSSELLKRYILNSS